MRYLSLVAAAGLALIALAAPASAASTASIQGDTLTVTGDDGRDGIELQRDTPSGTDLRVLVTDLATDGVKLHKTFPIASFSKIQVNAGGGDDRVAIDEGNGVFTDTIPTTVNGGDGDDTLVGGTGAETLNGDAGNDLIDPNRGNDTANGGPGDDNFTWDPGDGSDTDEGGDGNDALNFDGANVNEKFTVAPNGSRVLFQRDVANITMDLGTMERVNVLELGGTDTVTASPGLGSFVIDADGGAGNDTFNGSDEPDVFTGGTEDDTINGGGGSDRLSGGDGVDTISGGDGADTINGDELGDVLHGDAGDDTINGDGGDDQLFGDAGTDTMDGGDGADTIHCGGPGDALTIDVNDLFSGDCLPFPVPAASNGGGQANTPPTTTTTNSGSGTTTTGSGNAGTGNVTQTGQQVQVQTGLAAGTRGFSRPKIKVSGATLKVGLVNTANEPIHVSVSATEKVGHKNVALGRAAATLAPGQAKTLTLHASRAARKALHGRHGRRPVITVRNLDTGGSLTLKTHLH
jgi:Ca2+-binding RTX toxin-like protein